MLYLLTFVCFYRKNKFTNIIFMIFAVINIILGKRFRHIHVNFMEVFK